MFFFDKLSKYEIILASQSPRRRELLALADIPFRVEVRPTHENFPEDLEPVEVARYLCNLKMDSFMDELQKENCIVITADTIVIVDEKIINKPENFDDAMSMLRLISGRSHEVITGVCLGLNGNRITLEDHALVSFKDFSDEELEYYINNYQPFDKAGSYGVQDWIGVVGITRIEGTYANVMGLPVHKVCQGLRKLLQL
jgi:septum formation protein